MFKRILAILALVFSFAVTACGDVEDDEVMEDDVIEESEVDDEEGELGVPDEDEEDEED